MLVGVADTSGGGAVRPAFYKAVFSSWTDRPFGDVLKTFETSGGLEYWYGVPQDFMFSLRAGIFYEDPDNGGRKFVTFGAGVRYDLYGFDFSYISTDILKGTENNPLANTLRFTLLIGWGSKSPIQKGFPRGI